jgi:hypothetical protein
MAKHVTGLHNSLSLFCTDEICKRRYLRLLLHSHLFAEKPLNMPKPKAKSDWENPGLGLPRTLGQRRHARRWQIIIHLALATSLHPYVDHHPPPHLSKSETPWRKHLDGTAPSSPFQARVRESLATRTSPAAALTAQQSFHTLRGHELLNTDIERPPLLLSTAHWGPDLSMMAPFEVSVERVLAAG